MLALLCVGLRQSSAASCSSIPVNHLHIFPPRPGRATVSCAIEIYERAGGRKMASPPSPTPSPQNASPYGSDPNCQAAKNCARCKTRSVYIDRCHKPTHRRMGANPGGRRLFWAGSNYALAIWFLDASCVGFCARFPQTHQVAQGLCTGTVRSSKCATLRVAKLAQRSSTMPAIIVSQQLNRPSSALRRSHQAGCRRSSSIVEGSGSIKAKGQEAAGAQDEPGHRQKRFLPCELCYTAVR